MSFATGRPIAEISRARQPQTATRKHVHRGDYHVRPIHHAPQSRKSPTPRPIDAGVRIGHVHLKVSDLDRALAFYCGVLGFELTQRYGSQAAFISAGGYHHHIGLNTWESKGGSPPPRGSTGLYHTAILYPSRAALADALQRLIEAKIPLDGASDHGVSEALYLSDPDGNGVELYWDRPEPQWPRNRRVISTCTPVRWTCAPCSVPQLERNGRCW